MKAGQELFRRPCRARGLRSGSVRCRAESWRPVPTSCVRAAALSGCTAIADAAGLRNIAVAPDGRTAYGTAFNADAVLIFNRDPSTGALTQRAGAAGCMGENAAGGCTTARGHPQPGRDRRQPGRAVGVRRGVELQRGQDGGNGSLAVFRRNTDTGALTFAQCFSANGASGNVAGRCSVGRGMTGARDVMISPDQRTVYAGPNDVDRHLQPRRERRRDAATSRSSAGRRAASRRPTSCGCFDSAAIGSGGRQFSVSPDGANVYAARPASLVILERNTSGGANHGALSQEPGTQSCFATTSLGGECTVMPRLAGASAALVSGGRQRSTSRRARDRWSSRAARPARSPSAAASMTPGTAGARRARTSMASLPGAQLRTERTSVGSVETAEGPRDARRNTATGDLTQRRRHERGLRVDHRRGLRRRRRHDRDRRLRRSTPRSPATATSTSPATTTCTGSSEDGGGAVVTVKRDFPPICPDQSITVTRDTSVAVSFNCADRNGDA